MPPSTNTKCQDVPVLFYTMITTNHILHSVYVLYAHPVPNERLVPCTSPLYLVRLGHPLPASLVALLTDFVMGLVNCYQSSNGERAVLRCYSGYSAVGAGSARLTVALMRPTFPSFLPFVRMSTHHPIPEEPDVWIETNPAG